MDFSIERDFSSLVIWLMCNGLLTDDGFASTLLFPVVFEKMLLTIADYGLGRCSSE